MIKLLVVQEFMDLPKKHMQNLDIAIKVCKYNI